MPPIWGFEKVTGILAARSVVNPPPPFAGSSWYKSNAKFFLSYKGFLILGHLAHLGFFKSFSGGIFKTIIYSFYQPFCLFV